MWSMKLARKRPDTSSSSSLNTDKMLFERCNGYTETLAIRHLMLWLIC